MKKVLYILGKLTDADIDWLLERGVRRDSSSGEVLITEGEPTEYLFLVISGAFEVTSKALPGKVLARLGAGEVLGELSFLDSRPPLASVTAAERSQALAVPRSELAHKLEEDPEFAARFYRALGTFLASRLRSTVNMVGYDSSQPLQDDVEYEDELDPDLLDEVSLAASRFDWMIKRLRGE